MYKKGLKTIQKNRGKKMSSATEALVGKRPPSPPALFGWKVTQTARQWLSSHRNKAVTENTEGRQITARLSIEMFSFIKVKYIELLQQQIILLCLGNNQGIWIWDIEGIKTKAAAPGRIPFDFSIKLTNFVSCSLRQVSTLIVFQSKYFTLILWTNVLAR